MASLLLIFHHNAFMIMFDFLFLAPHTVKVLIFKFSIRSLLS